MRQWDGVALFVLRTTTGYDILHFIPELAEDPLSFASDGVAFLTDARMKDLTWFLVGLVPPIFWFIALIQIPCHFPTSTYR